MGKNSLIKSTSKKTAEKDADEKKKKAAAKSKKAAKGAPAKAKKAAAATAAKSKAGSKSKKGSKPKTAAQTPPKTKTAAKPKKTAPKKKAAKAQAPKKAVSIKDLLFQKFDSWTPESVFSPPKHEPTGREFTAPPLISTDDPDEAERIRALLFLKFDEASLKSAAEKAKTEQAAAQKAEADKAFIQKAAAEKAAAEKAKTEQAAAQKAEADKAFIQKAAAEKAAAEKAAAEKTGAKKAEPEPEVSVSYPPPPKAAEPADPMEKAFKYGIAGFAVLLVILIGASFANKGNYYLESANGGLKIYQGRFSPMGKELMITLPGVAAPAPAEEAYTMSQVYPLIYNYYLDKADALLGAQGFPDYQGIRRYLNEALKYAPTNEARKAVYERLDGIELMALLYRTDIAARKGTIESLEESLDYLNQAAGLEIDESQAELIDQKREAIRAAIEEKKAQAEAAEAAKTPAE
ncbi:MAG: hypothetical protein K9L59_17180 [Desulfobacterales bacterium]|nr:hypothetical protein [Desulfobacterales bacterium]